MRSKPKPYDRLLNHEVTAKQAAVAAALEPLDRVAAGNEATWGIGVLERIVSPETAAKFASARKKLDDAIDAGEPDEVAKRAQVMIKGWVALNTEAQALGHHAAAVDRFWAARSDNDTAYLFVQHETDTQAAAKAFPGHRVWSLPEVIRILEAEQNKLLSRVKDVWPAATVEDVRVKRGSLDDELPGDW